MTRIRISSQQLEVLKFLQSGRGSWTRKIIRRHIYGNDIGFHRLSASERASFSRSLARLLEKGFIDYWGQSDKSRIILTPGGKDFLAGRH